MLVASRASQDGTRDAMCDRRLGREFPPEPQECSPAAGGGSRRLGSADGTPSRTGSGNPASGYGLISADYGIGFYLMSLLLLAELVLNSYLVLMARWPSGGR